MKMQSVIRAIYPPQCVACDEPTEVEQGLCPACWRDTHFIRGMICDSCSVPMIGEDNGEAVHCDDCMKIARPWDKGRAALVYSGVGRSLVLRLKHSDRTDLVPASAAWMAQSAKGLLTDDTLLVPVPLHWTRMLKRKYNQAALLAKEMSKITGATYLADGLIRPKRTKVTDGLGRDARFAALDGAISVHPKRQHLFKGRSVLLVDDVLTSGATLAACADVCNAAGADRVCVTVLARVAKDL